MRAKVLEQEDRVVETPQNVGETGADEGLVEKTSRLLACFGGGVLLSCCVLVSLDVISRKLFNIVPFFSFELTGYGFGLAIALGYSYALLSKAHIRVNALYIHFPPAVPDRARHRCLNGGAERRRRFFGVLRGYRGAQEL